MAAPTLANDLSDIAVADDDDLSSIAVADPVDDFSDIATPDVAPEVVAQEAQRASTGALQAIDVMNASARLDWSEVNEHLDTQRLYESRSALAQAKIAEERGSGTGPGSEAFNWRREADFQRGRISPYTAAGRTIAQEEQAEWQAIGEVGATDEQNATRTPSEMISGFLGPGLSATLMPTVEATGRHLGSATGGALGAALATAATVGTGGAAPLVFGVGLSMLGAMAGGTAQEGVLQTTETDEETEQRHQRDAQAAAQNPGANLAGGMLATRPFFGPSLAQFGRVAAGDRGALMNIGMAGSIGAGAEVIGAAMRGETAKAKDIAAAFFSNAVMNEPTKLGRKLGLRPSSEQQAIEDAQTKYGETAPDPEIAGTMGRVGQTGLENRGTTSTADVFAGVPRRTAPEVSAEPTVETPAAAETQPAEAAPEAAPAETTSIQNAVTAEERAARGIDPVEEPARRAFGEVWDTVKSEIAKNPASPDALLTELRQKPRALTDREDALILHKQIELQKSFDSAAAEVNRAAEAGDEPARADAMAQLNRTRDALQEVYDIGKQAGTETARGLQARKMMVDRDFTLAAMETRLRAEQGGALTPEQQTQVKQQADTIAKTQEGMDKILAEREVAKAEAAEDAAVDPKVKSLADRIVARLDITAKNAATSLRSRLNNLGSAPDPLIVLDVAKIAAAKTAKGAIEFAQWSAEMIKEFGEKVRPFLKAGWDQHEQYVDAEIGTAVGGKARKERSTADKEASAVKARLTAIANRTAKLKERTAKGDFSPQKKTPLDLSKNPEWVKLKAENDTAKSDYEKARYEARKAQRSTQQKIKDNAAGVFSASRSVLASTDISAPGRQGIFFTLPDLFMNPVRLGRQLRTMIRSQFNEKKFQQNKAEIESRENADLYESSDLYLADIDHKPSAREEQFKSELAEKIPGFGRIVRGSSRGFAAFMNTVRADAMDAFVKWSGGKDNLDPETAKFLAKAINDLSGRGEVFRGTEGAMEWLAKYLFSPRLWVSRYNTVRLKPIWRDPLNRAITPRARAVVAGQYVKFVGALLALKFLAGLNGGKMEEDPRDSDFGKLQFGSKRYDVMGGIGNMVTLLSRIATRKTKDDKGKLVRIAWFGEKRPERELGQVLFNHLRNKGAPIPGAIYDYIYGRHPDRSKVTPTSMLKQTTVPITVSDTVGYFKKDNPASALRDTLINALGVSVKDYRE